MTTVAEYLTTEYTLRDELAGVPVALTKGIQRFVTCARQGKPFSQEWDNHNPHHIGAKICYGQRHEERVETRARTMTTPPFENRAPADDRITAYDERHFITYLRILDAAEEGADWREVVRIVFGLDAASEPERARLVHDSHLERARWMASHGYRHLLDKSREA